MHIVSEKELSYLIKSCKSCAWEYAQSTGSNHLYEDMLGAAYLGLARALHGCNNTETISKYARTRIRGSIIDFLRSEWGRIGRSDATAKVKNMLSLEKMKEDLNFDVTSNDDLHSVEGYDLKKIFKNLNSEELRIIDLFYFKSYSNVEIARLYGISEYKILLKRDRLIGKIREMMKRRLGHANIIN